MEQQVFMDLDTYNGIRLMQQNSEEQIQQQQYQQIMSGGDQQQEVIIQDDSQQQHIVYSPIKQTDQQQFIEPMQGQQYLIQAPGQQPQVVYANISPQIRNQQQQQTIQLNHNLIAQQNQAPQKVSQFVIHQGQQKVVVQRNSDILQSATNMAQIVDHSNLQYLTAQMDQNQPQQFIIQQQPQQQIKQTIYPQQQSQVMAQPQFMQIQQIQQQNVQPGSPKVIMQGNQVRFIAKPQQLLTNQTGQIMQLSQQPQQIHTQGQVRQQFRPQVRVQIASPQLQQMNPGVQAKNRTPRPRIVRPQAQSPLLQQQGAQINQQPRPAQQQKVVYMVQTQPDGTSVLVPHPQYNQQQQTIRMVQQKVVQIQQPQQQYQVGSSQVSELQQSRNQVEELAPTTSTFTPKKDGDCDDLEESITATAISKSSRSEPPPLQPQSGITMEEYRKRTMQQNNRVGVVRPMMNNSNNVSHSPNRNQAQQVIRQRQLPRPSQFPQQPGLIQQLEVPERESAKMLVILDNGEQRLITFTLPKETCTVQELLDQVGIQVGADSNIECIENPNSEIDYIVKVGNFASRDTAAMTKAAENHIRQQHRQQLVQNQRNTILQQQVVQPPQELVKSKSPEIKAPPPKIVPGFFAICGDCGFSSIDHAKCLRCNRIFKEDPKMQRMGPNQTKSLPVQAVASSTQTQKQLVAVPRMGNIDKKDQMEALQKKHQMATAQKLAARGGRGGLSNPRGKNPRSRAKPAEPVVVDLISDDDDNISDGSKSSVAKALVAKKAEMQRKPFEPDIVDDEVADGFVRSDIEQFSSDEQNISTSFSCRTIRIGTYKFDSKEKVVITPKGIKIVAPSLKNPTELIVLNIQNSEIVKIVTHFSKQLHIIFLYTKPSCARYINEQLQMELASDKTPYYSPLSTNEPQKKIVFLAESVNDETKNTIRSIYNRDVLDEISNSDANQMLVRSTGIPLVNSSATSSQVANNTADGALLDEDVKQLFIYPPTGKGGLGITTNDYVCLGAELYLNDVIIDFYLKYLHHEILTPEQRDKTHIFSQFFYKRLTQMSRDKDSKLTAAQKRHARVANWTKNVNIFEKDYVIIPINEQSHWFLAIICFPNLTEPHTMDTNQPIKLIPIQKRPKKKASSVQIGNTTITPLSKKEESISVGDDAGSERDEAEGDESDLGSNIESDEEEVIDQGQPVKVPSILIFDSLLGAPRARVVATLRDYLSCEYKAKYPNEPARVYNKSVISGNQVKVPQQNNFFDCGVFLLHYVEQFFKDPIKDYRIPIKSLVNWFHHDDVTRKREEIAEIIRDLAEKKHPEGIELPEIIFPTKNGKILVEEMESEEAAAEAFDENEYGTSADDLNQNGSKSQTMIEKHRFSFAKKRSLDKTDSSSGENISKTPKLNAKNKS